PQLSWHPLGQSLVASALYKRTGPGAAEAKFYTDRFALKNPYREPMTFRISKNVSSADSLERVLRDGLPCDYRVTAGRVEAELELKANGRASVEIIRAEGDAHSDVSSRFPYEAKVALRRHLSEFRDNHLARSARLMAFSSKLARRMPV